MIKYKTLVLALITSLCTTTHAASLNKKAIRYAYSAMLCEQQRIVASAEQQIRELKQQVQIGTFEGTPVYAYSAQQRQESIAYIQAKILFPAQRYSRAYQKVLRQYQMIPIPCSVSELQVINMCIQGMQIPLCEQPLMAAIVGIDHAERDKRWTEDESRGTTLNVQGTREQPEISREKRTSIAEDVAAIQ